MYNRVVNGILGNRKRGISTENCVGVLGKLPSTMTSEMTMKGEHLRKKEQLTISKDPERVNETVTEIRSSMIWKRTGTFVRVT